MRSDDLVNGLAVPRCFINQAWSDIDIRAMLRCESCVICVSPRVRRDMRASTSCPRSRTTQLGIGDGRGSNDAGADAVASGGADAGTGAGVAEAGVGVAMVVAVAAGGGWMYMYSGVSVGAVEISLSRDWCHVTSHECTIILVSVSMAINQSLPWL